MSPTDLAHVDLTRWEQHPEQHGRAVHRGQYTACFDPTLELLVQPRIRDFARCTVGSAAGEWRRGGIRLGAVLDGQFWTVPLVAQLKTVHLLIWKLQPMREAA